MLSMSFLLFFRAPTGTGANAHCSRGNANNFAPLSLIGRQHVTCGLEERPRVVRPALREAMSKIEKIFRKSYVPAVRKIYFRVLYFAALIKRLGRMP